MADGNKLREALRLRGVQTVTRITVNPSDTPIMAPAALIPPPIDTAPTGAVRHCPSCTCWPERGECAESAVPGSPGSEQVVLYK